IEIVPKRLGSYVLSIDNKTYTHRNVAKIEYEIDRTKISFVSTPSHTSFWERVKDAFIGDFDS
ncbi:NAD(+) kinase, partial [Streptococcus mutans]|nr:NAD(+) kinase [Streptococcus mutans]